MTGIGYITDAFAGFWRDYQTAIVVGVAVIIALVLAIGLRHLRRSPARSTVLARWAAVATMVWTSEGLFHVTVDRMHTPRPVAVFAFCVFELGALAAAMFAEEQRAATGVPGTVGRYVFVIAMSSGTVSALGEATGAGVFFRLILPPLFVGLWWILLNAERPTDTAEMRAERRRRAEAREATWVYTPRSIAVRLGLMKPGRSTATQAQREHQVGRMVVAADTIALGGWRAGRARRRLRRLARTADEAMVAAVAARVRQAVAAEALMVPGVDGGGLDVDARQLCDTVRRQARDARSTGARISASYANAVGAPTLRAVPPPELPAGTSLRRSAGTSRTSAAGTSRRAPGRNKPEPRRRPSAETRRLAAELQAAEPGLTQAELAARLGISDRRLRRVLGKNETA